jgi:hypothetical protein
MDLEANLMLSEELRSISIHQTCRTHFNEIRKKIRNIEDSNNKNWGKNNLYGSYNKANDTVTSDGLSLNDVDSSRQSIQTSTNIGDMQDLRNKYGVQFESKDRISEELLGYRDGRIKRRRALFVALVLVAIVVVYYGLGFVFNTGAPAQVSPGNTIIGGRLLM